MKRVRWEPLVEDAIMGDCYAKIERVAANLWRWQLRRRNGLMLATGEKATRQDAHRAVNRSYRNYATETSQ